jgi:hypothetical protein
LYFYDGAILNNSGNYELQQGEILNYDGVGTFNNSGTFKKTTTGTGTIRITFNNTGTVNVESGILNLTGGGVSNGGNFNLTSGKTLGFGGGVYTLNNGAKINSSGNLSVSGGTLDVKLAGGTAIANTVLFTLSGGIFQVDGNWNLLTTNNWNGGTLKSSGIITNSGTLTLGINSYKYLNTQLNNTGTIVENESRLYFYDGAILNNSGNYELQQGEILNYDGVGTFNNSGTFKKTTTATSTIRIAFNNTGTVEAQSGTLNFANTYTHNNANLILKGGTVTFSNALNINGGSIEGNASINVGVTNSGLLNPRYASNTEFGRLTINGNYTETNSASINIQLGGSTAGTNFDQVDINGNATFDGTLNVSRLNSFTPTLGSTFDVLTYDSLSFLSNLNFTGLDINSTLQFVPQWFNNKLTLKVVEKANATNINVTTNQDVVNASDSVLSLREAVIEANQNGLDNTIILGAQTYNLSFNGGSDDDFAATGDLDILPRGGLTIRGQGANQTFISTSNLANIFEIHSGATINFQDVTIITSVTLALSSASVTEDGTSNLVYTFTRAGVTSNALTVNYTVGGTSTFNSDYTQTGATSYTATTGTITFAAGVSTATLTIDPTADTTVESNETVALTLASGTGYTISTTTAVTGTINNDDTSVTLAVSPSSVTEDGTSNLIYTFTRTGVTSNALTVNYTVGGTATLGTDYTGIATTGTTKTVTFAANSSIATVTVDPTTDSTLESDETVALTLATGTGYTIGTTNAVTGTITNDDTSVSLAVSPSSVTEDGTSNLIYTFTRTGVTSNALTVNYTVGGTATLGTDYTGIATTGTTKNVTFAANSSIATVTVDPTTDSTGESNETVALTLATGTGYTIGTTNAVTGTITDDDTSVSLAVSPGSITEDGTTNLVYTFTRTGVTSNALTVNYTVGGTATFNTDYTQSGATTYTATTGTIAFAPNSTTASITIDPTADTVAEPNETIGLTLSSGSGYTISTPNTVTGTITDDDSTVTLTVSPSSVAEDGTPNILFTFTRTGNITNPLTVNYTVGGTATFNVDYSQTGASSYTSTAGTVSFAAIPRTVVIGVF